MKQVGIEIPNTSMLFNLRSEPGTDGPPRMLVFDCFKSTRIEWQMSACFRERHEADGALY